MANERLYQFPSKASPVPADIIYTGDSAAAFDEVNCTIAQIISAYPNLSGIGNLTLGANTFPYSNNSSVITAGAVTALAISLLADTTVSGMQGTLGYTATPTASQFAGWDANSNLSANNLIGGYATTVTAAGTTTLTVGSAQSQYFTGSTTQTVKMPVTSTLVLGQYWSIVNLSSGTVTVQSSGSNTITTVGANSSTYVTCILTSGTTAASWSAETPVAGSGVVNTGTINDLAYYSASGSTVSALATANNGVLVTSNTGVPSISTTLPSGLSATNMSLVTPTLGVASATSINFGGSTLSTYQTGTFTPVLVSSGGGTASYTTQTAEYTQIGNRIMFNIYIVLSSIASLTAGGLTISGLPAAAVGNHTVTFFGNTLQSAAATSLKATIAGGASVVTLFKYATGTSTQLAVSDISGTSTLLISGQYHI